jgi:hypothetical protein
MASHHGFAGQSAGVPCCRASTYDQQIRDWIKQDVIHGEIQGE